MSSRLRAAHCDSCVVTLCVLMAIVLIVTLSGDVVLCNVMFSSESSTIDACWVHVDHSFMSQSLMDFSLPK